MYNIYVIYEKSYNFNINLFYIGVLQVSKHLTGNKYLYSEGGVW